MTTMLEKMARAICAERYGTDEATYVLLNGTELPHWPLHLPLARAALQAIRVPDKAMVEDGAMAVWDMEPCGPFRSDRWKATDAYTAMIDAILNEKTT